MFDIISSLAGPIIGGLMQSDSADNASQIQQQGVDSATAEQRRQYDQTRKDFAPWRDTGGAAVKRLAVMLGLQPTASGSAPGTFDEAGYNDAMRLWNAQDASGNYWQRVGAQPTREMWTTPSTFTGTPDEGYGSLVRNFTGQDLLTEPGYQFGLTEGNKSIENAARARGMYYTPSTVKELLRYGTDYAGTKYNDAFNRDMSQKTSIFNMLSGLSGGGQTAANTVSTAGTNMANTVGGLITSGANARGAAGIAGANAIGSGIQQGIQNYQQNKLLDRILKGGTGSVWSTPPFNPAYGFDG